MWRECAFGTLQEFEGRLHIFGKSDKVWMAESVGRMRVWRGELDDLVRITSRILCEGCGTNVFYDSVISSVELHIMNSKFS